MTKRDYINLKPGQPEPLPAASNMHPADLVERITATLDSDFYPYQPSSVKKMRDRISGVLRECEKGIPRLQSENATLRVQLDAALAEPSVKEVLSIAEIIDPAFHMPNADESWEPGYAEEKRQEAARTALTAITAFLQQRRGR